MRGDERRYFADCGASGDRAIFGNVCADLPECEDRPLSHGISLLDARAGVGNPVWGDQVAVDSGDLAGHAGAGGRRLLGNGSPAVRAFAVDQAGDEGDTVVGRVSLATAAVSVAPPACRPPC